jgi:(3,5-dihydroxyphenyl)acetyl-CoA 1,2-dioxygenase
MVSTRPQMLELLREAELTPESLYGELTDDMNRSVRVEELVYLAADRVPRLVPTRPEIDAELQLPLAEKTGIELAQALLISEFLSLPKEGIHLCKASLEPTQLALDHLDEFLSIGAVDFGPVRVERRGAAGWLELSNPKHLNAEDETTLPFTEAAVDLITLDPQIQIGIFRGGVVEHPRHGSIRVFGSGINLTHLYYGRVGYLFYIVRDLSYVNKLYRGLVGPGPDAEHENLWMAVVERFAVGGACQLLHTMDHVIGVRGSRLFLPARKEGIIPGVSPLRLPRFVGDRPARQAILSGREWTVGDADAELLCDEAVDPEELEDAIAARVDALTNSGLVSAVSNRRAIRIGAEPLDIFRQYMAEFSIAQAHCHLSPALVKNLELNWNAGSRRV